MNTTIAIGLTLLVIFFFLVFMNVPIAVSLGITTIATSVLFSIPWNGFGDILYTGMAKYNLLAIPFFILCGALWTEAVYPTGLSNLPTAW